LNFECELTNGLEHQRSHIDGLVLEGLDLVLNHGSF